MAPIFITTTVCVPRCCGNAPFKAVSSGQGVDSPTEVLTELSRRERLEKPAPPLVTRWPS